MMGVGWGGGESFLGDSLVNLAKSLRKRPTDAEKRLWRHLKSKQINGLKFRRQEPIGPYFVDFCCREKRLVLELDGMSHEDKAEYDRRRQGWLEREGYQVVRVMNSDVDDLDAVARLIAREAGLEWNA